MLVAVEDGAAVGGRVAAACSPRAQCRTSSVCGRRARRIAGRRGNPRAQFPRSGATWLAARVYCPAFFGAAFFCGAVFFAAGVRWPAGSFIASKASSHSSPTSTMSFLQPVTHPTVGIAV